MIKNIMVTSIALVLITSCSSVPITAVKQAKITPSQPLIKSSKAISLFNGRDLTGWQVHGTEQWYVEDGLLVCKNGPNNTFGYLSTLKHYQDFQLTLEYKQEKRGNSGVFVRANTDNKVTGWQVEIAPPGHKMGGINTYQRGWLVKPDPAKDKVIKMGEWNKMKIVVTGGRITSWLNGTQMATINDAEFAHSQGSIALQIHGENDTHIKWRNINIIKL